MLLVILSNGEDACWNVGGKKPDILNRDDWEEVETSSAFNRKRLYVTELRADSDELNYIRKRFDNLPMPKSEKTEPGVIVKDMRSVVWYGDMARFIFANL